jgi:tetrahydromethanopterin S-methyltransferase subunit A
MGIIKKFMHFLSGLMPAEDSVENSRAVKAFSALLSLRDTWLSRRNWKNTWPVVAGHYRVGNKMSPVAVCTLTSNHLVEPLSGMNNVAIAGRIYTPNLGIEKMILNITANPNIRYLLTCGKESSVFHPGQAIQCLFEYGVSSDKRIKQAVGHYPVLVNMKMERIETFLKQVALINCTGEMDLEVLQNQIEAAAQHAKDIQITKDPGLTEEDQMINTMTEKFKELKIGGKRSPHPEDRKGFFVITVDQISKSILVKHYDIHHQPGYMIKGHSAQSILQALIHHNLVSELSHAGYLGAELAKAEASLKLNLVYEQDRPLRSKLD